MVFERKLPVAHFDFCLGCAEARSKDLEQVEHASTDYGTEGKIVEPSFWFVGGGLCGGRVLLRLGVWWRPWLSVVNVCGYLVITVMSIFSWQGSSSGMASVSR